MSSTIIKDEHFDIYFTSGAFLTLLGSVIENYYSETGGVLVGSVGRKWIEGENRPIIIINSVFPSVTARATNSEWEPNIAALKRVYGVVKSFSLEVLGEYHSHPNDTAEITDDDEEYILESIPEKSKLTKERIVDEENRELVWIEVVIRVKKEEYKTKRNHESKWWTPADSCKLRGKIIVDEQVGFDITLGAYAYFKKEGEEELDSFEIPVYSEVCSSHEN